MTELYRIKPKKDGEFAVMSCAELSAAKFAYEPTTQKPSQGAWEDAVWYCDYEDCAVREVAIQVKLVEGGNHPPHKVQRCPNCTGPMRFLHWLKCVTLVPVASAAADLTPRA